MDDDQAKAVFGHIITDILNLKITSPILIALEESGYEDLFSFLTLSKSDIENLRFKNPPDESITLSLGDKNLLIIFMEFVSKYMEDENNGRTLSIEQMNMDRKMFNRGVQIG